MKRAFWRIADEPGGYHLVHAATDVFNPAQLAVNARATHQNLGAPVAVLCDVFNAYASLLPPMLRAAVTAPVHSMRRAASPHSRAEFNLPGASVEKIRDYTFLEMLHFRTEDLSSKPKVLLFIPMSGHQAPVLSDTIEGLMPYADVYVSAPVCASRIHKDVPPFTLNDYRNHIQDMLRFFDGDVHMIAVSQPCPTSLAALSVMAAAGDPAMPKSAIFIGGPIDTRVNPQEMNKQTIEKGYDWFVRNTVATVEFGLPGAGRRVSPSYMRDRMFKCFSSNGAEAPKDLHPADLDAQYFLETIKNVFIDHVLPKGELFHTNPDNRVYRVDPGQIKTTAIMSIEGDRDDITGPGQTSAVHDLCSGVPATMHAHHLQTGAGHYGLIHGAKWRREIAPRVAEFIYTHENPVIGQTPAVKSGPLAPV